MVSTGLVAIDATVVATAVPTIVDEIGGYAQYPWLFSVYLLAQSVTVPVYSKLADTIGRKPVMLFGVAAFLLGSVLCGLAWSMPALIAFRAVQGLGAGAILPIAITITGDIYSLEERARVQGYIASVWAVSAVLGPALGGLFAELEAWRWIFFINIPLCLLAIGLLLRNFREQAVRQGHRIDAAGAVLLAGGMGLLLLGVLEGGVAWEWLSPPSVLVLAGGAVLLVVFALVERRAAEPVLPLWLFTRPVIAANIGLGLAIGGLLIGYTAFIPTYLEGSLGVSPLIAGLALGTLTIGWPAAATVSGRLYLRFGFRRVVILGGLLAVASALAIALLGPTPNAFAVAAILLVTGAGLGFAAVPSLVAAQSSVVWQERGVATGAVMLARSLGQAVGAAVLGAVSNAVIAQHGGDERDPAAVIAASTAVFVAAAVIAVLLAAAAFALPRSVPNLSEADAVGDEPGVDPAPGSGPRPAGR